MFDIGWSELMIIGVVALIVVGPKDLPMMFRKVGQFVGKARGMARDFQRAMDQAADDSGVKDIADSVKKAADIKDDLSMNNIGSNMKDYAKSYVGADTKPAADVPSVKPPKSTSKKAAAAKKSTTARTKKAPAKKAPAKKAAAKKPAAKKTPKAKVKS